jgi:hypothetical protein
LLPYDPDTIDKGGNVDAGAWIALGSLIVASFALVISFVGQRGAGKTAARSERLADEAAEHSRRSADAVERMASALEQQALARERNSLTPGVVWTLDHQQGDTYMVTNVGRAPAYDVHVDTGDIPIVRGADRDQEVIPPDGFLKFMAAVSFGTTDDTITISWAESPGGSTRHQWARPLPPRPQPPRRIR